VDRAPTPTGSSAEEEIPADALPDVCLNPDHQRRAKAGLEVPSCRPCKRRREAWDSALADAKRVVATEEAKPKQLQAAAVAADRDLRASCPDCDELGWAIDETGLPVEPARKCAHDGGRPHLRVVGE
jgi:hypothetical protein